MNYSLGSGCGCSGPCHCNAPQTFCPTERTFPPRMDTNILATMLVQTISCGNSDLSEYLTKITPLIVKRNGFCSDEMFYVSAQIETIDAAMMFVRNFVDFADSKSQSKSLQTSRLKSESESKAQSTSQNQSCGFSDASSFNQFNRESFDRSRSKSTTDSKSDGHSDSNTYDRSLQQASGISQVWDTALSTSEGRGRGEHDESTATSGASYSKTDQSNPGASVNDIDPGNAQLGNVLNLILDSYGTFTLLNAVGSYAWTPEGNDQYEFSFNDFEALPLVGVNITDVFTDTIDDGYSDPGAQNITSENLPDLLCCCDDLFFSGLLIDCETLVGLPDECHWMNEVIHPTYGQRYSADYNINFGATFIKAGAQVSISWGRSANFNQSHVITKACTSSASQSDTTNFYNQIDVSRAHGETLTRDQSTTQRDYHVRGDSERTAHSRTDAGAGSTGDAEAESESGAERSAHNESHGASQGTNWSKARSRGNSLSTSDSEAESVSKNLSDIFTSLSKMYDILIEQRDQFKVRFSAQQSAQIGIIESCKYAIPADPVTSGMLRSLASCWQKQICGQGNRVN